MVLRILRDNVSLTRSAYVEFDLQAMMDGEAYSDFFLLYLLCHQSRVEVPDGKTPEHCWLEKWYNTAAQQGVRALDQLRKGVQEAIEALAGGFLAHPANGHLREKLRSGELSTQDYYHQVLRQVYRLLFLFVAEDRQLLFPRDAPAEPVKIYTKYYSTQRLRALAQKRRGARHPDLFRSLRLVFEKLRTGCDELALPALGSFLFSADATLDLNDTDIANSDLLAAIRHLAFTVHANALLPINYRNLGPEELGSVYESLLEMHPEINIEAATFALNVAAGSERKTTGSYYTPSSLVNCLLDSALNPVLDEACKKDDPEKALLDLKICDPACGSGHFLIAAAHRLAKRLASVRAGEEEPAPESINHALRDVIGRCIYGVDINPLAVELCKVSLWIEALEPGKPLTFLDHHIQCGNSLLGTTPALMKKGIPNEAFKPIEGDIKAVCSTLRQENKQEHMGGRLLFGAPAWLKLGNLPQAFAKLRFEDDSTLDARQSKEKHYSELVKSTPYENARLLADAWCAAFVAPKTNARDIAITHGLFRQWEETPHAMTPAEKELVLKLRDQYNLFHWHLAFPDVFRIPADDEEPENEQTGWSGGFDCVLGNPPWERTALEDVQFFATRLPEVLEAPTTAARKKVIKNLAATHPDIHDSYLEARRQVAGETSLISDTGRFPLGARGRLNTYALFAELGLRLISEYGRTGIIVQTGIATDAPMELFWQALVDARTIESIFDFENRKGIFAGVHRSMKFCLLTLKGTATASDGTIRCGFFLQEVTQLDDPESTYTLTADALAAVNPNTKQPPVCRGQRDLELVSLAQRQHRILMPREGDEYLAKAWRALMSAGSSQHYRTLEDLDRSEGSVDEPSWIDIEDDTFVALIEAKQIHQFDPAFATYHGVNSSDRQAGNPRLTNAAERQHLQIPMPRFWAARSVVEEMFEAKDWTQPWSVGVRDVTNSTNERTAIMCILPRLGLIQPLNGVLISTARDTLWIVGAVNSFACDYIARQKTPGSHLNVTIFSQLPVPAMNDSHPLSPGALLSVLELSYVVPTLAAFALDCGYDGPPFRWDQERRSLIRCELDAAYFHLYLGTDGEWQANGTSELLNYFPSPRHAIEYIMELFPIVKRKDQQAHGRYRTKDTILEIYDQMAQAIGTGQPYQTQLDPAPGPPCDAQGTFIPMAQWDPANWPPHIHAQKEERITVAAKAPAIVVPTDEVDIERVLAAFNDVRQDMSVDYVVADPMANVRLQEAVRELGVRAEAARVNQALLNARKAGMLKGTPTGRRYRLSKEFVPYVFASEWSVRHLQRQLLKEISRMPALDELLCNPSWAARFDKIVAKIKPGFQPIDYRWAALAMRKKSRSRPEDKALDIPMHRQMTLAELLDQSVPAGPGLYLIRSPERPLYMNWAQDLLDQVSRHRDVAGDEMVPPWLLEGVNKVDGLSYTFLPGMHVGELQELRITHVSRLQPWLNLLDFGDAA
ncbi:MAG: N-6 DNA methylase [Desulfobacteraceae bacterium]|nr:N-6 DNA methylase [Desulfobacteraceae bacterium]